MEFWGVEIKAGETLKVAPNPESLIHMSQAALGELKKGTESVLLYVKIDDKKILLGTLSQQNFPQLSFDLVFEKEVELYHTGKNGSVYLSGYQSLLPEEDDHSCSATTMFSEEDSEEEEPLPITKGNNGVFQPSGTAKPASKSSDVKPDSSAKKAKAAQPKQDEEESSEEDESDDNEEDEDEDSEEGMSVDGDSEDEDESESDDEETPKKADKGKKRQNDSAMKTPVPTKKAKAATPEKTGGKKGGHTATPHPAKAGKATENGKAQTPKSGGKFSCNSCDRSFGSDVALQSHSKAKHGGK